MLRTYLTKWSMAAAIAVVGLVVDVRSSQAFHHWGGSWGSSGGSWGSSGDYWGSSGGSWGSSGGSWGSSGGSWGSSGGYWGSSGGSSGGSWGGHGWHHAYYYSSGGSWGSSGGSSGGYTYYGCSGGSSGGSSGGTVIYDGPANSVPSTNGPTGAPPTPPTPGPSSDTPPTPMPSALYRSMDGAQTALLNVSVPAEAKVFVNGAETTSTGAQRQFVSRGLQAGNKYAYEIRAEFTRDGQTVTETKTINIGPGQQASLAFNMDSSKDAPVAAGSKTKTKLTLHVPADAKVSLSGHETTSNGDVREFTTTKLAPGADWKDYTVRVTANVDGREVSKEETITLIGGEDKDLTFDFNSNTVASTAAAAR